MRESSNLYLEKRITKNGKEVYYIKERATEGSDPVVICLCQSIIMAHRVLKALQEGQKQPVKPRSRAVSPVREDKV